MAMKKKNLHNKPERNHQLKVSHEVQEVSRTCLSNNQDNTDCYQEENLQAPIISLMHEQDSADQEQTVKTNQGSGCTLNRNNILYPSKAKMTISKQLSDSQNNVTKIQLSAGMLIATNQCYPPVASKNRSCVNLCSEAENDNNCLPASNSVDVGKADEASNCTMVAASEDQMQKIQSSPKMEFTTRIDQVPETHNTRTANDPTSDPGSEVSHPLSASGEHPVRGEKIPSSVRQMSALKPQRKNVSDLLEHGVDDVATLKKQLQDQLLLKSVLEKEVVKLRKKASKSALVKKAGSVNAGPLNRVEMTGNSTFSPSESCSAVAISIQESNKSPLPVAQPNAGLSSARGPLPTAHIPKTIQPNSFTPMGDNHVLVRSRNDHVARFRPSTVGVHRSTEKRDSSLMPSAEVQRETDQQIEDLEDELSDPGEESSRDPNEEIRLGRCEEERWTIDNGNNGLTEVRVEGCIHDEGPLNHEPGGTESMDADFPPLPNHIFLKRSSGTNCSVSIESSVYRDGVAVSAVNHTTDGYMQSMETHVTDEPLTAQSLFWTDASSIHQNQDSFEPTPACLYGPESDNFVAQSCVSYVTNSACVGKKRYGFNCGAHGRGTVLQRIPEEVSSERETESSHGSDTSEDESTGEASDTSESHEDRVGELEAEVARLEEEKRAAVERADELDEVVTRLDTELKAVMIECEQVQHQNSVQYDLRLENTALRRDLLEAEKTVDDLKTQVDISNNEKEKLRSRLDDDHKKLARLTTKMELFEANVDECVSSCLQARLQDAERSRQQAVGLAERALVELRACCERVTHMERELTFLRASNNVHREAVAVLESDIGSGSAPPGCVEGRHRPPSPHVGVAPVSPRPASDVPWPGDHGGDASGEVPLVDNTASNLSTEDTDPIYSTSIATLRAEVPTQSLFCKADVQAQSDDLAICKSTNYLLVNCSPATSDSGVYLDAPTGAFADVRSADVSALRNEAALPGELGSGGNVSVIGREGSSGAAGEIRLHLSAALAAADRALVRGDTSASSALSNDSPACVQGVISPSEDPAQLKQQVSCLTSSLARVQCRLAEEQLGRSETSSQRIARYTEQEALRLVKESEQLRDEVAALQLGLIAERGWVAEGELLRAQAKNEALERRVLELEELKLRMENVVQQEKEILRWPQKLKAREDESESSGAACSSNANTVVDVHVGNNVELVVESVSTQTEDGTTCWEPDPHTDIGGGAGLLERAVAAETARAALSAELDSVRGELSQARDLLRQWNDYYQYYLEVRNVNHRDDCSRLEHSGMHSSDSNHLQSSSSSHHHLQPPEDAPTIQAAPEAAGHQVAERYDVSARAVPPASVLTEVSRVMPGVPDPGRCRMPSQEPCLWAVEKQASGGCIDEDDRRLGKHFPLDAPRHDSSSLDTSCHPLSHQAGRMTISGDLQQFTNVVEQIPETYSQEPQSLLPPARSGSECSLPGSNVHPRPCPPDLFSSSTAEPFLQASDTRSTLPEIDSLLNLLGSECSPISAASPAQLDSGLHASSLEQENKENEADESRHCETPGEP